MLPEIKKIDSEKSLNTYMSELDRLDAIHQELLRRKHKHVQANIALAEIIEKQKEIIAKFPFMKEVLIRI